MVLVLWCDVGGGGVEENLCPATSSSSGAGRRWNEEVCAPSDCTLAPADMHAMSSVSRLWRWGSILTYTYTLAKIIVDRCSVRCVLNLHSRGVSDEHYFGVLITSKA